MTPKEFLIENLPVLLDYLPRPGEDRFVYYYDEVAEVHIVKAVSSLKIEEDEAWLKREEEFVRRLWDKYPYEDVLFYSYDSEHAKEWFPLKGEEVVIIQKNSIFSDPPIFLHLPPGGQSGVFSTEKEDPFHQRYPYAA